MDGVGLTIWLSQNVPHVRVVLATGTDRMETEPVGIGNVCAVLRKPFGFSDLEKAVEAAPR